MSSQGALKRAVLAVGVVVVVIVNVVDREIHCMDSSVAVVGKSLAICDVARGTLRGSDLPFVPHKYLYSKYNIDKRKIKQ